MFDKTIRIGGREIGPGRPCFIIAEAGSNHDRKLDQAFEMIDVAAEAGADAVKFQTYSAETLYSRKTPKMSYLKKKKVAGADESVWEMIKRIEMPRDWHAKLVKRCEMRGVVFLSTPFDERAVTELERVGIQAYKTASFEINHIPLLTKAARTGKPVILSTGMADLTDIETALAAVAAAGNRSVALLHCAISYPPRHEDLNLRAMDTMRAAFGTPVGFSDHTLDITADIAAVARGADIIEKHFTLSRKLKGPDHPFALEPDELRAMCGAIRDTEKALGSPVKRRTAAEEELHRLARRSLVAARDIAKGAKITRAMVAVKRPGYGISPVMLDVVVGRAARVDIEADDIITWDMI